MNVGGVPWTGQRDPSIKHGFRNVMLLCVAMLLFVLLCFIFPALYSRITAWQRRRAMRKSWSLNRKSFLKRTVGGGGERGGYLRLWGENSWLYRFCGDALFFLLVCVRYTLFYFSMILIFSQNFPFASLWASWFNVHLFTLVLIFFSPYFFFFFVNRVSLHFILKQDMYWGLLCKTVRWI